MSDQPSRAGAPGRSTSGLLETSSSRQDWSVFLWRVRGALQKRYTMVGESIRPSTAEHTGDRPDQRDEELMQALVTAGALVALSDGQLKVVEREELLNFVEQQGFVSTISRHEIAEAFDNCARQLEGQNSANVIVDALRPLAGLSLASVVVRVADRVAVADGIIQPGELRALKLIRLVLKTLGPADHPRYLQPRDPRSRQRFAKPTLSLKQLHSESRA
jgi:tellurite resistance protein